MCMHNDKKQRLIFEIDRQLSFYRSERESDPPVLLTTESRRQNTGKISALDELKKIISTYDVDCSVEEFFDLVYQECRQIPNRKSILGDSASSSEGMRGKSEACERIRLFIQKLMA